jgi:hypothetical protein
MKKFRLRFHGWLVLILSAIPVAGGRCPIAGQELIEPPTLSPESQPTVKALLVDYWDKSPEIRTQAEQLYGQVPQWSREIVLAYVANRLHGGLVRDAISSLDQWLLQDPGCLDATLIRAHLNLRVRDFDQAILDLRKGVRLLHADQWSDRQREEAFYRIGRMVGFLEGPVQHRANRDLLTTMMQEVQQIAGPAQAAQFKQGLQEILELHRQNALATGERFERELEIQEKSDAQREQSLTQENDQLARVSDGIVQQISQVREQGNQRESQLAAQLGPLEANLYNLDARVSSARFEVLQLHSELVLAQNALIICPITIGWIRDRLRLAELNLFSLQNSYAVAVGQIRNVNLQIQQNSLQTSRHVQSLEVERKQAAGRMNRNQRELARIARGPEVPGGKREAMENRLVSLASYIQLSPAAIRQDLLDRLE